MSRQRFSTAASWRLLLLGVVPLVLFSMVGVLRIEQAERESVQWRNRLLAETTKARVEQFVLEPARVAVQLRGAEDVLTLQAIMDSATRNTPVESILLVGPDAKVRLASAKPGSGMRSADFVGVDMLRNPQYLRARSTRGSEWSSVFTSPVTGARALQAAIPVNRDIALVTLSIEALSGRIEPSSVEPDVVIMVLGFDGKLLFHSDSAVAAQRVDFRTLKPVADAMRGRAGDFRYVQNGESMLASTVFVQGPRWVVMAEQDWYDASKRLLPLWLWMGSAVVIVAMLAAVVAFRFSRTMVAPVSSLRQFAQTVRDAQYHDVPGQLQYREFEDLAESFREMARAVGAREELLSRTGEIGKIGGWELDVATGEMTWTPEAARINDLHADGARQLSDPIKYVVPEMRASVGPVYRRAMEAGRPFDLEFEIATAEAVHKWVRVVGRPVVVEDEVVRFQGIIQDVSDRHAAEEALRSSEDRFRSLVEQMPEGMLVVRSDGRIEDANPAACHMTGYSIEELQTLSLTSLVRPEDVEAVAARLANIESRPSEWVTLRKDGSVFYVEAVGKRLWGGGTQLIVRDVTERRRVEQLIRDLNSELERKVAFRTAEVEAANRELEAFAYAVSHDLRAPLRAMNGFCKALEEDYGDSLDEHAHEYIGFITEGSRAMSELIDALLALSRDTRGDMRHERVDVTELVNKVIAQRRQFYPDRDVDVEVEEGMSVFGDARMVNVLVANLIGNAWKYTMKRERARITVDSSVDELGRRWISVADDGAGFDMRYAGQLFEPFHRLHRQDDFPGIGIGLATVKRIINRHGGKIRAEASPGDGATFSFWLPGPDELIDETAGRKRTEEPGRDTEGGIETGGQE